ncbi:MAG TPA: hypothetical protein VIN59_07670 [Alphaproteobacteria bacterium]
MKPRVIFAAAGAAIGLSAIVAYSVGGDAIVQAMTPVEHGYTFDLKNSMVTRIDQVEGRPEISYVFNFSTQVIVSGMDRWTFDDAGRAGIDTNDVRRIACTYATQSRAVEFQNAYC